MNEDLVYVDYGVRTSNMILRGVCIANLHELIKWFPKLHKLTVTGSDIGYKSENSNHFPFLQELHFIDNTITNFEIQNWFGQMKGLKTLHLQGDYDILKDQTFPELETLTLRSNIERLFSCPKLKKLTICCWTEIDCDQVKMFFNLEHLRVIRSVDEKYRCNIEALYLQSTDIYYCETPKEQNLLLQLNEDCLVHLISFLSIEDCASLQESHSNFLQVKTRKYKFEIHEDSLSELPLSRNLSFYTRIAPLVSSLVMESVSEEDFVTLMPLFTNLEKIKLQRLDFIGKNTLAVIPNGLTSLSLTSDLFNKDNKELFHRLNSTITELSLTWYNWDTAAQPKGLSQLQNIQELTCIRLVGKKCINQLLKVNLAHLRDLSLVFYKSSKFDGELWQLIGRMSSLRKLYVNLFDTDICIPSIPQGSLPMLQKLFINSDREEGVMRRLF